MLESVFIIKGKTIGSAMVFISSRWACFWIIVISILFIKLFCTLAYNLLLSSR